MPFGFFWGVSMLKTNFSQVLSNMSCQEGYLAWTLWNHAVLEIFLRLTRESWFKKHVDVKGCGLWILCFLQLQPSRWLEDVRKLSKHLFFLMLLSKVTFFILCGDAICGSCLSCCVSWLLQFSLNWNHQLSNEILVPLQITNISHLGNKENQ